MKDVKGKPTMYVMIFIIAGFCDTGDLNLCTVLGNTVCFCFLVKHTMTTVKPTFITGCNLKNELQKEACRETAWNIFIYFSNKAILPKGPICLCIYAVSSADLILQFLFVFLQDWTPNVILLFHFVLYSKRWQEGNAFFVRASLNFILICWLLCLSAFRRKHFAAVAPPLNKSVLNVL